MSLIVTVNVLVTDNPSWSATTTVIVVLPNCPVTGVKVMFRVAVVPVMFILLSGTKAVFDEVAVTVISATGVVSSATVIATACVV